MSSKSITDLRELLQSYLGGNDREAAFRKIAGHLSGLIYHSAFRQSGDAGLAEEVTQNVLLQISRKANKLVKHPEVLAWVHEATRLEILQMQRAWGRRKKREEIAMKNIEKREMSHSHDLADLDESLRILSSSERELVLMKFFEGRTYPAIAARTGRSQSAEKMRLKRALEKMSNWFGKKGVTLSVVGLTTVLSTEMGKAAPIGIVTRLSGGGVVASTAMGAGKVGPGLSFLVAAGLAVPLVSSWGEVNDLERRRDQLLEANAEIGKGRRSVTARGMRRHWSEVVPLEATKEEWEVSMEELVWRFHRADVMNDDLTEERLVTRVKKMDRRELTEFCRILKTAIPHTLMPHLRSEMTPVELLEFMMETGASDGEVGNYLFEDLTPIEGLRWLVSKERAGEIVNRSERHDYRGELWNVVLRQFRFIDQKEISTDLIQLIGEGRAVAPKKVRPYLEKLSAELKEKGGSE